MGYHYSLSSFVHALYPCWKLQYNRWNRSLVSAPCGESPLLGRLINAGGSSWSEP